VSLDSYKNTETKWEGDIMEALGKSLAPNPTKMPCPLTASMKGKNEDVNLVEMMDIFLVAACLSLSLLLL